MAEVVYALCGFTSAACAVLLLRKRRPKGQPGRLLLWTGLCFAGLAVNNALLFIDLVVVPATDLSVIRSAVALVAMMLLLYGLIWESI